METIPSHELEKLPVTVERARIEDADEMVAVHADAWLDTYPNPAAGISKEDIEHRIYGHPGESDRRPDRIERYKKIIETQDNGTHSAFVARQNSKVIGFAWARVSSGGRRELQALYVSPKAQGIGVGGQLLEEVFRWHGPHDVYSTVVAYNDRAISFYEKHGFVKTGNPVVDTSGQSGDAELPEVEIVHRANSIAKP